MASPKPEPVADAELAQLDGDPDVDMANAPAPEESSNNDAAAPSGSAAKDAAAAASGAPQDSKDKQPVPPGSEVRQEALDLSMQESRIPMRKDVALREFLSKMDDYAPVIPDAVTFHALTLAGLPPPSLASAHGSGSGAGASGSANEQAREGAVAQASSAPSTTQTQTQTQTTASSSSAAQQQQQGQQPSQANGTTTSSSAAADMEPHTPLALARLLALATQKFVADIAADAYQYSRMRSGTLTSNTLSALSNPGAPGPSGGGGGNAGGGGGGGGAGGAAGGGGAAAAKQVGQHVLGVQRPGYGGGGQGGQQGRTVLTMEDLGMAVGEYGVNVKRGEFYR